jgi:hypothetical protein
MKGHLLFVWCALLIADPRLADAQFTDPHTYDAAPTGINVVEVAYAAAHADASIDTSLVIAGAHLFLNQGTIKYDRYFGLFDRLTWAEAAVPVAGLSGSVTGTQIQRSTAGLGDSSYALKMLLMGGPALTVDQFGDQNPTTRVGVSITVTAPTGSYNPDRILNLGADRWAFKPEVSLSYPFGRDQKWQLDSYANVSVFTDNTAYHGVEILRQEPLLGLEEHVSYSFSDNVWVSSDLRYAFRGATDVDGINQDNPQHQLTVGSETNVSLNSRHALIFEFAKAVVHRNSPNAVGIAVKYDVTWGKGYK